MVPNIWLSVTGTTWSRRRLDSQVASLLSPPAILPHVAQPYDSLGVSTLQALTEGPRRLRRALELKQASASGQKRERGDEPEGKSTNGSFLLISNCRALAPRHRRT